MAESSAGDFTVGKIQKTRRQRVAKKYGQQKRNIIHMSSTAYEQESLCRRAAKQRGQRAPPHSNHLVGALLENPRHVEAERLRDLEIDDEVVPGRRLHRQVTTSRPRGCYPRTPSHGETRAVRPGHRRLNRRARRCGEVSAVSQSSMMNRQPRLRAVCPNPRLGRDAQFRGCAPVRPSGLSSPTGPGGAPLPDQRTSIRARRSARRL